ncbi:MAG: response regulator, partial [Lutimaribacter sp.]
MSGRVLIVDDVATNRIVMRFKLASAFYDTLQAASGAEALAELALHSTSVVVVAHALADMSGADLCQKLRAPPHTRH